jgi:cytochrome P450
MAQPHSAKKDLFYHLLHAKDPETGRGFSTKELWGEANLLMIAGSDTTATALASTLFYLCRNRDKLAILQDEVRGNFNRMDEIVSGKELGGCHYLKACIDEALRLAPPVAGILHRQIIAKEGSTIDGEHLPEGIIVGTPIYSIHHNSAYYKDPFSFTPERWLHSHSSEEEVSKAQSAFTPFSIGARGCIGKSVAYMELRIVIARLVWGYEFWQRETEGKAELWREGHAINDGEFRLMDHFTCQKEGPVVVFEKRSVDMQRQAF